MPDNFFLKSIIKILFLFLTVLTACDVTQLSNSDIANIIEITENYGACISIKKFKEDDRIEKTCRNDIDEYSCIQEVETTKYLLNYEFHRFDSCSDNNFSVECEDKIFVKENMNCPDDL